MSGPFTDISPREYSALIADLAAFHTAYAAWMGQAVATAETPQGVQRQEVVALAARADRAIRFAGIRLRIDAPPLAQPRPSKIGLHAVAFAHEDPAFNLTQPTMGPDGIFRASGGHETFDQVIDAVQMAQTLLEREREEGARRRKRPSYWVDRGLRAVLGFPAYLLSLVFGFDRRTLSAGRQQGLWVLSALGSVASIVGLIWLVVAEF